MMQERQSVVGLGELVAAEADGTSPGEDDPGHLAVAAGVSLDLGYATLVQE
jgi:hypothetical protein